MLCDYRRQACAPCMDIRTACAARSQQCLLDLLPAAAYAEAAAMCGHAILLPIAQIQALAP